MNQKFHRAPQYDCMGNLVGIEWRGEWYVRGTYNDYWTRPSDGLKFDRMLGRFVSVYPDAVPTWCPR